MKDNLYQLTNQLANKRVGGRSTLNAAEVATLNYAYALNGSPLRYEKVLDKRRKV